MGQILELRILQRSHPTNYNDEQPRCLEVGGTSGTSLQKLLQLLLRTGRFSEVLHIIV